MDPIVIISEILKSAAITSTIKKAVSFEGTEFAKEIAGSAVKQLLARLKPTSRERIGREAIRLFSAAWLEEVVRTTPISASVSGYKDELKRLIQAGSPEIIDCMNPERLRPDLGPIETVWLSVTNAKLPKKFDWGRVADDFGQGIRRTIIADQELRAVCVLVQNERQVSLLEQIAGRGPGFDIAGYRQFLVQNKCNALELGTLHSSTYAHDRRLTLWSVFVEPSAREAAPIIEVPPEELRRLRIEGQITEVEEQTELDKIVQLYWASPVRPVLSILDSHRLVALTGDPGSGKTSVLRYRALEWAETARGPLPLLVDLKQYARDRRGLLEYLHSGCEVFRLDATSVSNLLDNARAVLLLDGLDEIIDPPARFGVMEEIAVLASRYPRASLVVTSRKLGYDPHRLTAAGFKHATLEDLDRSQVTDFSLKWHALAEAIENQQMRLHSRLMAAIDNSRSIRELTGNPLLLTMIAILNRNQELPRDRVELYREASRVLLHEWDAHRALRDPTFARQEKEELLSEIAGSMQQNEGGLASNLIPRADLINRIRHFLDVLGMKDVYERALTLVQQLTERNFILSYAGADRYCFVHRTFLEYFCAKWLVEKIQIRREITFEHLLHEVVGRRWPDQAWHEVLRLVAGMLSTQDAASMIAFLVDQKSISEDHLNLILAAGCLAEVRNRRAIQDTEQNLARSFLENIVESNDPKVASSGSDWVQVVWDGGDAKEWLKASIISCRDSAEEYQLQIIYRLASLWGSDRETWPFLRTVISSPAMTADPQTALQIVLDALPDNADIYGWLQDVILQQPASALKRIALAELVLRYSHRPHTLVIVKNVATTDNGNRRLRKEAEAFLLQFWPADELSQAILDAVIDRARDEAERRIASFISVRYRPNRQSAAGA